MASEETRSNLIAAGVGFLPALRRTADELRSAFVTRTVPNLLSAPIDCSKLSARSSAALLGFAWLALATGPAAAIVGGAPFADQAIARHADLEITLSIYAHTNLDAMREALDKIDWETE